MARYNLEQAAAAAVELAREQEPEDVRRGWSQRLGLARRRGRASGQRAPRRCTSRSTSGLGIHPQDDVFLDREVWDLEPHPAEKLRRCCCTTTRW